MVRRRGDRYVCALCGAELDLPAEVQPRRMFIQSSGGPTFRALLIDGKEIHRCEVNAR